MISLIRWGALGTVLLLARAIVREAKEHRSPVILLPAAEGRGPARNRRHRAAHNTRPDSADEPEMAEEPLSDDRSADETEQAVTPPARET